MFVFAEQRVREEGWGGEKIFEVLGGMSVNALVGEEGDLVLNSEWNREPVERFEDGGDVVVFAHPHQDPGSAVLDVMQSLYAPARDPDEECIAVIQPGRRQRRERASLHLPG